MERPVLHGPRLTIRPMTEADVEPIAAIVQTPEVSEWWPESGDPERLRAGLGPDDDTWAIDLDGELIGWLAITEEDDPDYRYASLDISLDPAHIGAGLGPEALRVAIDWLVRERGHHRFTIDPAAANERAIRAYASVGFKPVGIVRRAERGPDGTWRDALLMDLLADELR
jgi:aminoglycoside 6'-N-acetyltransferase